eukprot:TRINITY_DN1586_c1_g2_i1.p1 TRINITY_DN1586_c1_g2~~TRINITY_DN1586_c1_g2_i1.p1  ORF type:complete len:488 (+),score=75.95 TRINITY_DN1586_c1_g2_i1:192-1655(+)
MLRPLYWFFHKILTVAVLTFFSTIEVVGREFVPRSGPVIICSNHPNMALDPILVAYSCGRDDGHFWAMAPLFKGFKGTLLRSLGAIPVQRREDNVGKEVNNTSLFSSSFDVLDRKACVFIFPEGKSYTDTKLQPIRTGTLRLALEYLQKTKGIESVPIVPCGISYAKKDKFRSQVLVQFGKAVMIPNEVVTAEGEMVQGYDEHQVVSEYTQLLSKRMRHLTVNVNDWDTMRLVATTRRLYINGRHLELQDWLTVTRRIAKMYEGKLDNPEIQTLKKDIAAYQETLDTLTFRDSFFTADVNKRELTRTLLFRLVVLLCILPFAVVGSVLYAPVYALAKYISSEKVTKDTESRTMVKIGVSVFLTIPLTYTFVFLTSAYFLGFYPALSILICLPIFSLAHAVLLERSILYGKSIVPMVRLLGLKLLGFTATLKKFGKDRAVLVERIQKALRDAFPDKKPPRALSMSSLPDNAKQRKPRLGAYDRDEHFI